MSPDECFRVGEEKVLIELPLEHSRVVREAAAPRDVHKSPAAKEEHGIPCMRHVGSRRELVSWPVIVAFRETLDLLHADAGKPDVNQLTC